MKRSPPRYTVHDDELILWLEPCDEGGYCVTSPLDPGLVTQAETIEEAFEMARDGLKSLQSARAKLAESVSKAKPKRRRAV
ncbi:MAG: type II toxin-antitoxin system HicB family antitoxin [Planctomycetaceae bacterium]|nr:type II toxin-antitoxin system HicB family antitoxin [Planctomycetaceae bacterium]